MIKGPWKAPEDAFLSSHSLFALCSVYYCCVRNYSKLQVSKQSFYFAYAFVGQEFSKDWAWQLPLVQVPSEVGQGCGHRSKGSAGLEVQDGALTQLTVCAGSQLGTR